jgi:hypothetical protein
MGAMRRKAVISELVIVSANLEFGGVAADGDNTAWKTSLTARAGCRR